MNDLLQVEQGGNAMVDNVQVIPFYFYFKAASAEADQLIKLVNKILELVSGLPGGIEALLETTHKVAENFDSPPPVSPFLGLIRYAQSPSFRQPYVLLEPKSRNKLICVSICFFTRDPTESLVYDILQLNVLHTGRPMFQLVRYSRHRMYSQQCENSVDAYPLEVANFKAELKTTPEMASLLNAEERPNKNLESQLRSDIKTLMKGEFTDARVYKSATVDYLVSEGEKLSVAFHVNFDGYRVDTSKLDEWKDDPIDSTLLTRVTTQGRYPTHKRITCSNLKSVKLDILVPRAATG
ncbi:hypothetical protein T265_06767 [Opisthorchis viverrini]|uniref:Uncharacterized protein n=1 Tax=Opisthorchis viverrini TaxID=6198 RepID=A0A074ZJA0_OPIVI|nr:hypothetical protein T265_06767 [Opisthorchis viverrini]KER25852.1 hypothetical protein T265_06767 [Opisthorchis viverrini]